MAVLGSCFGIIRIALIDVQFFWWVWALVFSLSGFAILLTLRSCLLMGLVSTSVCLVSVCCVFWAFHF